MKARARTTDSTRIADSRWLAYATASAATMLTGASSADAEIHYSGRLDVHFPAELEQSARFPLAGRAYILAGHELFYGRSFFEVPGPRTNACLGYQIFETAYLHKLNRQSNQYISQHTSFLIFYNYATVLYDPAHGNGEFYKKGIGFVGYRFDVGAGVQYGWARVRMHGDGTGFIFVDYAYGDPGDRIKPGQTGSAATDTVTDEGSVGLLALGATGLTLWRRRKNTAHLE
jgi:MYXO-CTERM domain-containing protein